MVQLNQKKISLMSNFSNRIICWYKKNGRHELPWRKNISPYSIWISEIMLQQTQVKTVIPYFNNFIEKYPNLEALLKASEDEILASIPLILLKAWVSWSNLEIEKLFLP